MIEKIKAARLAAQAKAIKIANGQAQPRSLTPSRSKEGGIDAVKYIIGAEMSRHREV